MSERSGATTLHGNPLTLLGEEPKVGEKAPNTVLTGNDLKPVPLSSYEGKVVLISSVPSLDTPVCDTETRRFNEEATSLGEEVVVLTVSTDLPFAQARWCGAAGVDRVVTLSDHRDVAFGKAFGVLIKDLRILARAVFVVDRQGVLQYQQLVREMSEEPDYAAVLEAVRSAL